jgi:hypothetical protein
MAIWHEPETLEKDYIDRMGIENKSFLGKNKIYEKIIER